MRDDVGANMRGARVERLMALDAVAIAAVGVLFGWLAVLASPDAAREMRDDAEAMLAEALYQLKR